MEQNKRYWNALFGAICLIYVFLRFWHLTDSCLWFDEIFGVHAAAQNWSNLIFFVAQDLIHPPLFYILLKIWIIIGGESLLWLRSFPVVFAILALFPFFHICRALKLNQTAIAAALLFFAANGALIKYAQEVRMYSLLLCFSLASIWLFIRVLNLGKSFTALVIINILLVYAHYFGWFVVVSEVVAVLFLRRGKIRQILLMLAITFVSFAPWIFAVWRASKINADVGQNIGWQSRPNAAAIFQFALDLVEPLYFQASSIDSASLYYISIPLLLIIAAAKIFYLLHWKNRSEMEKRGFYLLALFTAAPILLAAAASWIFPYSIWGTRHLIIAFAPAMILAAKFLTEIEIKPLKTIFLALIAAFYGLAFLINLQTGEPRYIWCAWENFAPRLASSPNKKIYAFEDLNAYHLWFATRSIENAQIIRVEDAEGIVEDKAYFLPRGFDAVQTVRENEMTGERFFVAFRDVTWNEKHPPLRRLIEKGYHIGEPQVYEAQGLKAFLVEVSK